MTHVANCCVAVLRLFAQAREIAGTGKADVAGNTVDEVLAAAIETYGEPFSVIVAGSKVWLNGEPASGDETVGGNDEVAVLPPVSGG